MKTWKLDIETKVRYDINNGAKREESVYWIKEDPVTPNNVVAIVTGNSTQDAIKNGHLLAAAPEMYQVLDEVRKSLKVLDDSGRNGFDFSDELEQINNILKKARGES